MRAWIVLLDSEGMVAQHIDCDKLMYHAVLTDDHYRVSQDEV